MKRKETKKIAHLAILSALSIVFYMFLKFPLPFFPPFLDIQFSNLPVIIAGFAFGPIEACIVCIVRFLIKIPASSTMIVGESADLIIGCLVGISTSIIYKKEHTKKGGIKALIIGSIVWVIGAIISNAFILLPWFMKTYGAEQVLGMLSYLKGINEKNYLLYYIMFAVVPFNLLLASIVSLITFFVYKRVSNLYNEEFNETDLKENKKDNDRIIIGITIITMDLLIFIAMLVFNGKIFNIHKNSLFEVILVIGSLILILGLGIFLIIKNNIKNK